jgi:hypothetical protein
LTESTPHLPRVLGLSGLSVLLIAAIVNLNSVPVVAAMGPVALLFWWLGFLFLFFSRVVPWRS